MSGRLLCRSPGSQDEFICPGNVGSDSGGSENIISRLWLESATSDPLGLKVTVGQIIHRDYPEIPADNWMADPRFGGHSRKDQIKQALQRALDQLQN